MYKIQIPNRLLKIIKQKKTKKFMTQTAVGYDDAFWAQVAERVYGTQASKLRQHTNADGYTVSIVVRSHISRCFPRTGYRLS
jgi:hypothetical protein